MKHLNHPYVRMSVQLLRVVHCTKAVQDRAMVSMEVAVAEQYRRNIDVFSSALLADKNSLSVHCVSEECRHDDRSRGCVVNNVTINQLQHLSICVPCLLAISATDSQLNQSQQT